MIWLYRLCFLPALFFALPWYGLRMWRRGGYRRDFGHRFGRMRKVPPRRAGVRRIWIQAVSVGELLALEPLLTRLHDDSSIEVCLTTTTSTGRRVAEEKYAGLTLWRGIFPLDWLPFIAAGWHRLNPDLVVLMESEIWPEHLHQAARRNVPVILLNARLSDRSYRRYSKLRSIARPLLRPLTAILAGTPQDAERFAALDLPGIQPLTSGNMKFDVALTPILDAAERAALRAEIGAGPEDLVLLGASTWPGEEAMIVSTAATLSGKRQPVRALLVPRHAERRSELAETLGGHRGMVHFRTNSRQAPPESTIYVADTTGELQRFTQIADIVFVGKTMPPHTQGQTPIEAAGHGRPILIGSGTSNFRQIAESLVADGAARRVSSPADFTSAVEELLENPAEREAMGLRGRAWYRRHQGATGIALKILSQHLPPSREPSLSDRH